MNPIFAFMIIATVISLSLLIYTVLNHFSERSFFLIFISMCSFFYTFGYLLEIVAPNLEAAFTGVRVQKVGSLFMPLLSFLFVRDIYGEKRYGIRRLCLLFALPVFNFFTAQAFPWVRLHYTGIEYFHSGSIANCHGYAGVGNYISIAYNLLLALYSIWYIVRRLRTENGQHRMQSLCLLAAMLIPLCVNLYHSFSYNRLRLDLNPIAISISVALLLYSVRRQNLLNVVPLARAWVIEFMSDAFVVCSNDNNFLDANGSAKRLFPELEDLRSGDALGSVIQLASESQFELERDGELRFYTVVKDHVLQNGRKIGICMVFRDITDKENQIQWLYDKATYDPLMNIYNRATFFELTRFILGSDKAKIYPYTLLMIDLDNFKMVNDTYGHPCGDMALKTVADIVKGYFRKNDIVGRYGGEEIVVLMENISIDNALAVAERLRKTVEETAIAYGDSEIRITISIGVTHAPIGDTRSLDELLAQADTAMYQAKNAGRNRIRLYEPTENSSTE